MTGHKHHHKNCILVFKKLSEYLDGELDAQIGEMISRHLGKCVRCQVCLEMLRRTIELLRKAQTKNIPEREFY